MGPSHCPSLTRKLQIMRDSQPMPNAKSLNQNGHPSKAAETAKHAAQPRAPSSDGEGDLQRIGAAARTTRYVSPRTVPCMPRVCTFIHAIHVHVSHVTSWQARSSQVQDSHSMLIPCQAHDSLIPCSIGCSCHYDKSFHSHVMSCSC